MYGYTRRKKRIAAIVCAYNESPRLERVLKKLVTSPVFVEVIVVDDGSTDGTSHVARDYPVRLIRLHRNMGKGYAMDRAVQATRAELLFFCDADAKGLTESIIRQTLSPVVKGETEMMIAMRNRKIYFLRFLFTFIPLLGGERALSRSLWEKVPALYKERFMIEAALNFYARHYGDGFRYKVFRGLSQTIKEKKYGIIPGFLARLNMIGEVATASLLLQLQDVPRTIQSARLALINLAGGVFGICLGALAIGIGLVGPATFLESLYREKLATDPSTPFVDLLIGISVTIGNDVPVILGVGIILVNLLVVIVNLRSLRPLFVFPSPPERVE